MTTWRLDDDNDDDDDDDGDEDDVVVVDVGCRRPLSSSIDRFRRHRYRRRAIAVVDRSPSSIDPRRRSAIILGRHCLSVVVVVVVVVSVVVGFI